MAFSKTKLVVPIVIGISLLMVFSPLVSIHSYAASPNISVYLGYMDNDHSEAYAPSPWCGSAGVQFVGSGTIYNGDPSSSSNCGSCSTPPCGTYDGGAILIQNNDPVNSITITNFTVLLPPPVTTTGGPTCSGRPQFFNIWFNPANNAFSEGAVTVPPGGEVIFAQTSGGGNCPYISGSNGISGNSYPYSGYADFDTSDFNFQTSCTPSTDTQSDPQIYITLAGQTLQTNTYGSGKITYTTEITDSTHRIDTGGFDPVNDGCASNESEGWALAGTSCSNYNSASCLSNSPPPTSGVPEFPFPLAFVVGIGVALVLVARRTIFSIHIPTRILRYISTSWQ